VFSCACADDDAPRTMATAATGTAKRTKRFNLAKIMRDRPEKIRTLQKPLKSANSHPQILPTNPRRSRERRQIAQNCIEDVEVGSAMRTASLLIGKNAPPCGPYMLACPING